MRPSTVKLVQVLGHARRHGVEVELREQVPRRSRPRPREPDPLAAVDEPAQRLVRTGGNGSPEARD